jgi:predicted permease
LFRVNPLQSGYKDAALLQFHQTLLENIAAIPGVQGVTLSENGLFSHTESADPIWVEGYTPKTSADKHARFDQVGPHYFSTVGIPLLMGRDVDPHDGGSGLRVGWINQTMARFYFPDTNPLGKHIRDEYPDNPGEFEIVGVVADAKYNSLRETTPRRFYVPFFNPITKVTAANFEIRTRAEPAVVAASLREVVKSMDRSLPTLHVHTMTELVDQSLARERLITSLSGLFGTLAVLLAFIGLYGIMAFAVARRTNEIGIRMALGAQRRNVLGIVMRETLVLVLLGIGIGLPVVFATTRLLSKLLFGLTPVDPATIFLATMAMISVAALAGYLPAYRASRVDPTVSLRYE